MIQVSVQLLGGLGNQMFQYAAARALADRTGASVGLDVSQFVDYTLRKFDLGALSIRAEVLPVVPPKPQPTTRIGRIWASAQRRFAPTPPAVYREKAFTFDADLLAQRPPVRLEGYFQSEKYFVHDAEAIRRDFSVRGTPDAANQAILDQMASTTAVSLHVRRGDYVNDPKTAAYHGSCSPAYYEAAVEHIAQRCGALTLFVFSDDQDWVRANMRFAHATVHVDCNPPDRGIWDMHLMKHCRHHVIANSSFSWWGAWLNPSPEKIVVAPARWFNTGTMDTSDLVPAGWVRL